MLVKTFRLSLLLCALFLINLDLAAQAEEPIKFSDNWPRATPPSDGYFSQDRNEPITKDDEDITPQLLVIYPYFEPKNISPGATVVFSLKAENPGYVLRSNSGTVGDAFYCEEAIWTAKGDLKWVSATVEHLQQKRTEKEPEPKALKGPQELQKSNQELYIFNENRAKRLTTHFACRDLFFEQYPNLKNQVVVMHFIPCCLSNGISRTELHSLRNLKAIRVTDLQNPKINELRAEWISFIAQARTPKHPPYTRQEILNEADFLENKYSSLFVDLTRFSKSNHKLWVGY